MSQNFQIAFDEAHKPRGRISGNFSELKKFLESEGFVCQIFMEFPITRQNLSFYDILVIPCPDNSLYSEDEIKAISTWVKEDGGGLVMLNHAGGDKGRRTNLSELGEKFGMSFENDQVLDKVNNFGLENLPEISSFIPPHPITEGLESICFRAGCSLSAFGAISVVSSSEEAEPFSSALIVATEIGEGKVVGCGSYEIFRDKIMGGFQTMGHEKLASNIFSWLKTDYRNKVKTGEIQPKYEPVVPISKESLSPNESGSSQTAEMTGSANESGRKFGKFNIESTVKISDKSDLAELLYILLDEANILRGQIQTVIDNVIASEEQILDMQHAADSSVGTEKLDPEQIVDEIPLSEVKSSDDEKKLAESKRRESLTPLPKKITTGKAKKIKKESKKKSEISAEDIRAEFQMLQSKMSSIEDLKTLVNNKFKDKKIEKEQREKQIKRLERDENKTLKRIEELTKLLENP
jgi:predicted nucleic-acid-binding protein